MQLIYPSVHGFKNSVTIETGLLHSQPSMNSQFHFLTVVEMADSQMFLQWHKKMTVS
jgi:hypothetical protein